MQLLGGDTPSSRYVSFPLAAIKRENGVFKFGDFVPPLLSMSTESPLWLACSGLAARMREKSTFLAKQTSVPSSDIEDRLRFLELRDQLRSIVVLLPDTSLSFVCRAVQSVRTAVPFATGVGSTRDGSLPASRFAQYFR